MKHHFITGATGFVGGAIALELLDQTDAMLHCLVNADDMSSAAGRLQAALESSARAYERTDLLPAIASRCHAVCGDITLPLNGELTDLEGRIADVWHAAGTRKFDHSDAAEIELQNVGGTRNMLTAATRLGASTFNYVSSAYVAGKQAGCIAEALLPETNPTHNLYEVSKLKAEHLVAAAPGLHTRIFRPSLVVGHSRTFAATTFAGIYGFIRDYREFCSQVSRQLGSYLRFTSMSLLADPGLPINVIPVDAVARNAVRISHSDSADQIFHLTNATPPTIGAAVRALASALGVREPRFVESRAELTLMDEALNGGLESYESFALVDRSFDLGHTDAVCGPQASDYPLDGPHLGQYIAWYLQHLESDSATSAQPVAAD